MAIEQVLRVLDDSEKKLEFIDASMLINPIVRELENKGETVPGEILAEQYAFELILLREDGESESKAKYGPMFSNGDYSFPEIKRIDERMVRYWVERAKVAAHPLLRARYADLAWDFARRIARQACSHEIPRIAIDGYLEAVQKQLFKHDVHAFDHLSRALVLAASLKDEERMITVRNEILSFEDHHATDQLAGLWGFSFDRLLFGDVRVPISKEIESQIVQKLEGRLERLTTLDDAEKIDPHLIDCAAGRLAKFYRRKALSTDLRRVLSTLGRACIRKADKSEWHAAAGWLRKVMARMRHFGLNDEAAAIEPHYREAAKKMRESMKPIETSFSVSKTEMEDFVAQFVAETPEQSLALLTMHFVPIRSEEEALLKELRKDRPILDIFAPELVDNSGQTVATIGTMSDDPEGNLIEHISQQMKWV